MLAPFKLERYFARYEFSADYLLCCSDCESVAVADLLRLEADAEERLKRLWLGYTEAPGNPALRREIAAIYGSIHDDEVLVHSGAEEAIYLFMRGNLTAGDHVVVHWPCYQSLAEVARAIGCHISPWIAREEAGWCLDGDELKTLIRPETRAVILNTPHNPTGFLMERRSFEDVVRFTEERGIILFSDEVYRGCEYREEDRLPAACDVGGQAVSLGVMSKTYGLAGLRIGWIATRNQQVRERMAALKDYTTICNSAPSELLAEIALRHRQSLARRNVEIIRSNLGHLDDFFSRYRHRFRWRRPDAGPIAFPRLIGAEIDLFCDRLVKKCGVLLLPGSIYDHPGNHFRIGCGRRNLPQALQRLEDYLRKTPEGAF
ncbi:MAG: aminotransferase class I/II-fold pyridoxal phosphate-dependent enzyme [Deltaproteobacteria bacterium]|nr:aminotransferase class I/II-fold pyridoxal phosphate-dependent enzyme [Deltaproteobacteria bacterium]